MSDGRSNHGSSKRSKRPLNRVLPSKLHEVVPESKVYTQLQAFERRLDSFITRKRLDLLEQRQRLQPMKRTLRVFVSNTAADQYVADASAKTGVTPETLGLQKQTGTPADQAADTTDNGGDSAKTSLEATEGGHAVQNATTPQRTPASWSLHIEGRLLGPANATRKQNASQPKFTTFVKSIVVNLEQDQNQHQDGNVVEWTKLENEKPTDAVEIKRIGDSNVKAKILIFLDSPTQKFKLSTALASLLNIHTDTLNNVITAMWQYIKTKGLQDSEDRRLVNADRKLRDIFGEDKFSFAQLPSLLAMHFFPADPIVIEYEIRTDVPQNLSKFAYDIEVEIPNTMKENLDSFLLSHFGSYTSVYEQTFGKSPLSSGTNEKVHSQLVRDIQHVDESITENIQNLIKTQTKIDFLSSFEQDPVNFINKWCEGQARDANAILGDDTSHPANVEATRRREYYEKTPGLKDTVQNYLGSR